MQACVVLPDDTLLEYSSFCTWIAQALVPSGEHRLHGIACIVGKCIDCTPAQRNAAALATPVRGIQSDLLDGQLGHLMVSPKPDGLFLAPWDDSSQMTLAEGVNEQYEPQVTKLSLQYRLTDDDRSLLESVLPRLPSLRHPISEAEAEAFIEAWSNLPNRPQWQPVLITASTIESREKQQDAVAVTHQQQLQSELDRGRIVAVDADHVPVARLTSGCFISRTQAIEYLDRIGVSHCDEYAIGGSPDGAPEQAETQAPEVDTKQSLVGKPKLTKKERQEMIKRSTDLDRQGVKAFRKIVAEEYGVSEKTVYNSVKRAQAQAQEQNRQDVAIQIDKVLAGKRR